MCGGKYTEADEEDSDEEDSEDSDADREWQEGERGRFKTTECFCKALRFKRGCLPLPGGT